MEHISIQSSFMANVQLLGGAGGQCRKPSSYLAAVT